LVHGKAQLAGNGFPLFRDMRLEVGQVSSLVNVITL